MAEIHKIEKNGVTIYPATTTDAVVDGKRQRVLVDILDIINNEVSDLSSVSPIKGFVLENNFSFVDGTHIVFRVLPKTFVEITGSPNGTTSFAFVKTYNIPSDGDTVDYSSEITSRIIIQANETYVVGVPYDAKYIILNAFYFSSNRLPSYLKIGDYEYLDSTRGNVMNAFYKIENLSDKIGGLLPYSRITRQRGWLTDKSFENLKNGSHFIIPIDPNDTISIKANSSNPSYFTILKDYIKPTTTKEEASFATGISGRITVQKGMTYTINAPDDAKFLLINSIYTTGDDRTPEEIKINGVDLSKTVNRRIGDLNSRIERNGYDIDSLKESAPFISIKEEFFDQNSLVEGYYSGSISNFIPTGTYRTQLIEVEAGNTYTLSGRSYTTNIRLFGFNGNEINGPSGAYWGDFLNGDLIIPEGGKTISLVNNVNESFDSLSFSLKSIQVNNDVVTDKLDDSNRLIPSSVVKEEFSKLGSIAPEEIYDTVNYFDVKVNTVKPYIHDSLTSPYLQMSEEASNIQSDHCVCYLPEGHTSRSKPAKIVLYFHGSGEPVYSDSQINQDDANAFATPSYYSHIGYAVIAVNGLPETFANSNRLHYGRPCGNWMATESAIKAIDYCADKFNLDKNKIFVHGISQGGMCALNFIDAYKGNIACVALDSPVLSMKYTQIETLGATINTNALYGILDTDSYDKDKVTGCDPWIRNCSEIIDIDSISLPANGKFYTTEELTNLGILSVRKINTPIKHWQGALDISCYAYIAQLFAKQCINYGSLYEYRMMDGVGHNVDRQTKLLGNFEYRGITYNLYATQREMANWFARFGGINIDID